jgi:hypothetical protein
MGTNLTYSGVTSNFGIPFREVPEIGSGWPVNPIFGVFPTARTNKRFVATPTSQPHFHILFAKNLLFRDLLDSALQKFLFVILDRNKYYFSGVIFFFATTM